MSLQLHTLNWSHAFTWPHVAYLYDIACSLCNANVVYRSPCLSVRLVEHKIRWPRNISGLKDRWPNRFPEVRCTSRQLPLIRKIILSQAEKPPCSARKCGPRCNVKSFSSDTLIACSNLSRACFLDRCLCEGSINLLLCRVLADMSFDNYRKTYSLLERSTWQHYKITVKCTGVLQKRQYVDEILSPLCCTGTSLFRRRVTALRLAWSFCLSVRAVQKSQQVEWLHKCPTGINTE